LSELLVLMKGYHIQTLGNKENPRSGSIAPSLFDLLIIGLI
jgi:hypothetical protein